MTNQTPAQQRDPNKYYHATDDNHLLNGSEVPFEGCEVWMDAHSSPGFLRTIRPRGKYFFRKVSNKVAASSYICREVGEYGVLTLNSNFYPSEYALAESIFPHLFAEAERRGRERAEAKYAEIYSQGYYAGSEYGLTAKTPGYPDKSINPYTNPQ